MYEAIQLSENRQWKLKLSGWINPTDAHAYDVTYHNVCYMKNVTNVLRRVHKQVEYSPNLAECASQVEFIDGLKEALLEGKIVSLVEARKYYRILYSSKGVLGEDMLSIKSLKTLIESELYSMWT